MGKKIAVFSYLCGALSCRRTSSEDLKNPKQEDSVSTSSPPTQAGHDSSSDQNSSPTFETASASPRSELDDLQNLPLPPPPGRVQPHHTRTMSYNHQHKRSFSAGGFSKKLTSSLSMKVGSLSFREDYGLGFKNKKKLQHEDSVWKKTIILGEKCRVPEEDDDAVYYDEKGNRISTYRPKNSNIAPCVSRQRSGNFADGSLDR